MVFELVENDARGRWLMIRMRSTSSRRMVPTKRSAIALARGARMGDLMTVTLMAVKTASEGGGELGVAIADEEPEPLVGVVEVHGQVAGLLVSQEPVGWAVTPRMWTRPVACSMTKKTYSRFRVMVSRWNTLQARMPCACARRNSVHEGPARRGEGSMPEPPRIFQTVEAPI